MSFRPTFSIPIGANMPDLVQGRGGISFIFCHCRRHPRASVNRSWPVRGQSASVEELRGANVRCAPIGYDCNRPITDVRPMCIRQQRRYVRFISQEQGQAVNWIWTALSAFASISLLFAAWHAWRISQEWQIQGWVSNGLGKTIYAEVEPKVFALVIAGMRFWAVISFLAALFAFVISIGWAWKALGF